MVNHIGLLEKLKSSGLIQPLDFHLAIFFTQQSASNDPLVQTRFAILVVWLSMEVRSGHVCINLNDVTKQNLEYRFGREQVNSLFSCLDFPTVEDWFMVCKQVGDNLIGNANSLSPFILSANRLYFQRMWQYENQVADYFNRQFHIAPVSIIAAQKLLTDLFPHTQTTEIDWQKVATASAIINQVTIVSGGPGTGKTTTVSKILAILVAFHQQTQSSPLRIVAAAPTGKAAARLTESLSGAISTLPISQSIKASIPIEALTLHRLLGASMRNNQYMFNKDNPLNVDILLIDEASMIDLPMMASVIAALPEHSRLILLGDKEQLSSVEAGAVFGDLCEQRNNGYSQQYIDRIKQLTGYHLDSSKSIKVNSGSPSIADSICLLQKSYRFSNQSSIGILANLIKEGDSHQALALLNHKQLDDVVFFPVENRDEYQHAIAQCTEAYQYYLAIIKSRPDDIATILTAFNEFRLLCALRDGPFGVKVLNKTIENLLYKNGYIHFNKQGIWYIGRPVMILKNSFSLGLFNGDIGITLPAFDNSNQLKVYFRLPSGEVKGFSTVQLPEHETAYAMTIHKSQGSEFVKVAIILPDDYSPLLTRSLFYTAITRAKKQVVLYSSKAIIEKTIKSQISRQSGLRELLN